MILRQGLGGVSVVGNAGQRRLHGQFVTLCAQAADQALGDVRKVGMLSKCLTGDDIRQMDFNEGNTVLEPGVPHGN